MIPVPSGVRVWLAVGATDMRRGMNGLSLQVQEALRRDPHGGDLFVFRGRGRCRQNLPKAISASSTAPACPRAIGCEGAGGCVIASQDRRRTSHVHVG